VTTLDRLRAAFVAARAAAVIEGVRRGWPRLLKRRRTWAGRKEGRRRRAKRCL